MTTIEIYDDLFGHLEWDEQLKWWEGYTIIDNQQVQTYLSCDKTQKISEVVRTTFQICKDRNFDYREAIVAEMLDLYNESWREEGNDSIDEATFLSIIEFESIHANSDGRIDIDYVAGDLFTDHAIEVRVNPDGTVLEICLAG